MYTFLHLLCAPELFVAPVHLKRWLRSVRSTQRHNHSTSAQTGKFLPTREKDHSIPRFEFLAVFVPAELGWGNGVTLTGQADRVAQGHIQLFHHVFFIITLVSKTPGCFSICHSVKDWRNWWEKTTCSSVVKPSLFQKRSLSDIDISEE